MEKKLGRVVLNGRVIYSEGRTIISANPGMVIFSDGSSMNLETNVVTNLSPDLRLYLDVLPADFEMPKEPVPVVKTYVGKKLKVTGFEGKILVMPKDSKEIEIPAHKNIHSSMKDDTVEVYWGEPESIWANIPITSITGMRIEGGSISMVGNGNIFTSSISIFSNTSFGHSVKDETIQTIFVPYGTQIVLNKCDEVEVGDVGGSVKIESGDELKLTVGNVEWVDVDVTGELSVTNKTGNVDFTIVTRDAVNLDLPSGCAGLKVSSTGVVTVKCKNGPITGNISIDSRDEVDFQVQDCLGNVDIKSTGEMSLSFKNIVGKTKLIARDEVSFTFVTCTGAVDIESTGECTINGKTLNGDLDLEIRDAANMNIKTVKGNVKATSTSEMSAELETLNGNIDLGVRDEVGLSIGTLNGKIKIECTDELHLTVLSGEVGSVELDVRDEANVKITTTIASIKARITDDGTFRIKKCLGTKDITIRGDKDIEIG